MSAASLRWPAMALAVGLFAALPSGCVVPGDGGYGMDYYEPYGVDYGGWGSGYYVAPYGRGDPHAGRGGGGGQHAYRAAPASHSMPSIPSGGRSGGGRGGGGHRG